jgi:KDO2-lipid IV(A) lauroyltransferase
VHSPLRWNVTLLYASLCVLGRLPLSWLHVLGAAIGWLVAVTDNSLRRRAQHTLSLAAAPRGDLSLRDFMRAALIEAGKSFTEIAKIWTADPQRLLALVREVRGGELFDSAHAAGRGLIIAAPHLGCWELLNYWAGGHSDKFAIVYRQPRQVALEPLLLRVRGRLQPLQIRAAGTAGLRTLYKHVAAGGVVMIMPDQEPKGGEGEFAPFFGTEALTMVLLSRLAQRTGATVLFAFVERLSRAAGYRLHFLRAPADIADPELPCAAVALNRGVEDCVRLAPVQYQWHYKRYSIRPKLN